MASVQEINRLGNNTTSPEVGYQNVLPVVSEGPNTHQESLSFTPREISIRAINEKPDYGPQKPFKLNLKLKAAAAVGAVTAIGSTLFPTAEQSYGGQAINY